MLALKRVRFDEKDAALVNPMGDLLDGPDSPESDLSFVAVALDWDYSEETSQPSQRST